MASSLQIVQRIENDRKRWEPLYVKLRIFDIGEVGYKLDVWIELLSHLFRNSRLWFLDVLVAEEELTIQITEVDRI